MPKYTKIDSNLISMQILGIPWSEFLNVQGSNRTSAGDCVLQQVKCPENENDMLN